MATSNTVHTITQSNEQAYYEPGTRSWTAVNVGQAERWVSAFSGGALLVMALLRRDKLGIGLGIAGIPLLQRGITGHCYTYQLLDITTVENSPSTKSELPAQKGLRVQRRMTINRSSEDLYAYWHDVEKAPTFMRHIASVTRTGERTSHWTAKGPFGRTIEWNSEILQDMPGRLIAWHVHGKPNTANAGKVTFEPAPANQGTIVTLELDFLQLNGPLLASVRNIVGQAPEREALEDLRHFRELMEAGELPTTHGQPTGKGRKEGGML